VSQFTQNKPYPQKLEENVSFTSTQAYFAILECRRNEVL